jgi:hypothetical protein
MAFNSTFDTVDLLGIIPNLKTPARWLRDTFFAPRTIRFDTKKIQFDRIIEDRRVANYVQSTVAARARQERGFQALMYEAPYIKEKSEIKIEDAFERGAGEGLGGDKSPEERYDDAVVDLMQKHEDRITRREELQAAEVLRLGQLTISGDGYDPYTIPLGRDAGQTITLAGAARWNQAGVDPFADLQTWSFQTQRLPYGGPTPIIAMDPVSAGNFLARIKANGDYPALDRNFRGSNVSLALGPQPSQQYRLGDANGFEFWVYQDQFENAAGQIVNVLPDNTVIGISPNAGGSLAYGAIRVARALKALARYPRIVGGPQFELSTEHLVTESSPMTLMQRINATFCATVA